MENKFLLISKNLNIMPGYPSYPWKQKDLNVLHQIVIPKSMFLKTMNKSELLWNKTYEMKYFDSTPRPPFGFAPLKVH